MTQAESNFNDDYRVMRYLFITCRNGYSVQDMKDWIKDRARITVKDITAEKVLRYNSLFKAQSLDQKMELSAFETISGDD